MIEYPPLFDSCVISKVFDPRQSTHALVKVAQALIEEHGLFIPSIVEYEIRRGFAKWEREGANRRMRESGEVLLRNATVLSIDTPMRPMDAAVQVYAASKAAKPARSIGELDLLIYATAVAYNRTLVTADAKLCAHIDALFGGRNLLLLSIDSMAR